MNLKKPGSVDGKPPHQTVLERARILALAFVLGGAVLDAISNSALVSAPLAAVLSLFILGVWSVFHALARKRRFSWNALGGQKTQVSSMLGLLPWVCGLLLVLWISPAYRYLADASQAPAGASGRKETLPQTSDEVGEAASTIGPTRPRNAETRAEARKVREADSAAHPSELQDQTLALPPRSKEADSISAPSPAENFESRARVEIALPSNYANQKIVLRLGDTELSGLKVDEEGRVHAWVPLVSGELKIEVLIEETGEVLQSIIPHKARVQSSELIMVDLREYSLDSQRETSERIRGNREAAESRQHSDSDGKNWVDLRTTGYSEYFFPAGDDVSFRLKDSNSEGSDVVFELLLTGPGNSVSTLVDISTRAVATIPHSAFKSDGEHRLDWAILESGIMSYAPVKTVATFAIEKARNGTWVFIQVADESIR